MRKQCINKRKHCIHIVERWAAVSAGKPERLLLLKDQVIQYREIPSGCLALHTPHFLQRGSRFQAPDGLCQKGRGLLEFLHIKPQGVVTRCPFEDPAAVVNLGEQKVPRKIRTGRFAVR